MALVLALDVGEGHYRTVRIEAERRFDSETYTVSVFMRNAMRWRFEFAPIGWQPNPGIVQSPSTA